MNPFVRSLRGQLVLVVLLLHVLVFAGLVWMTQRSIGHWTESQLQRRAQTLEVELAAALTGPIIERDYVTLAEIARELVSVAEVRYLVVTDAAGRELVRVGPEAAAGADVREFVVRISGAQARLGLDVASATAAVAEVGRSMALWALAAAALAAGLTVWLALGLTHRIGKLAQVADGLARGDWHARAPARTPGDELDRLGHAFNQMAQEIEARVVALEHAQQQ
ncbi:MAG: HAMP domain-containing protein, partial [Tepidimonas sp.]|uniref:HAMP domain-containing protein n=1 Tax=Tepidimonas sp. TaxID=2002775 RepID=UPI00298F2A88